MHIFSRISLQCWQ